MEEFKTYDKICGYIPYVMNALYNHASFKNTSLEEIRDAFRLKQLLSKAWLIDNFLSVVDRTSKIFVVGSWLGYTSFCLYKLGYKFITECDMDHRLESVANHLNRENKNFLHITSDINTIDTSAYDVIINTSCEHIEKNFWFENLRTNQLVFLQSTDLAGNDHCNLCLNILEMKNKYRLKKLLYADTLNLNQYNRFMIYGHV